MAAVSQADDAVPPASRNANDVALALRERIGRHRKRRMRGPVSELLAEFGVEALNAAAVARINDALSAAGILCTPPLTERLSPSSVVRLSVRGPAPIPPVSTTEHGCPSLPHPDERPASAMISSGESQVTSLDPDSFVHRGFQLDGETSEERHFTDTKVCPECAEEVKQAAKVCRFCGHRFDVEHGKIGAQWRPHAARDNTHSGLQSTAAVSLVRPMWWAAAGIAAMAIGAFGPWASALGGLVTITGTSGQRDGWLVLVAAGVAAVFLAVFAARHRENSAIWVSVIAGLGGAVCVYDLIDLHKYGLALHPDWGIYLALAGAVATVAAAVVLAVRADRVAGTA